MRTIVVTVCSGTACYILGGSDLLTLPEHLPKPYADHVMLAGAPCLNHCKDRSNGKRPPYVTVDGKLFEGMDMDSLKKIVIDTLEST